MLLQKGEIVTVFNQKITGEPMIEGRARIVGPAADEHQYRVRFLAEGEGGTYDRYVFVEHQADPQAALAAMVERWEQQARG
jgi:hypothetical protein